MKTYNVEVRIALEMLLLSVLQISNCVNRFIATSNDVADADALLKLKNLLRKQRTDICNVIDNLSTKDIIKIKSKESL